VPLPVAGPLEARALTGLGADAAAPARVDRDRRLRPALEADPALEHGRVDENAAAFAAFQQTFFQQLLVGQHHGVARHAELIGQPARRR
jgi:hypothetical protein